MCLRDAPLGGCLAERSSAVGVDDSGGLDAKTRVERGGTSRVHRRRGERIDAVVPVGRLRA